MEIDFDFDGSFDEVEDMGEDVTDYQPDMEEISDITTEDIGLDLDIEDEELSDISVEERDYDLGYDIDNMSIDELRDLRDKLTSSEIDDTVEMEDVTVDIQPDYSYHWDGDPTHDTEWDEIDGEDPNVLERVLKR